MATVKIDCTLGTDSSLVSLAVRVDFILRMFLTMNHPGRTGRSSLQSIINRDELVMGSDFRLQMGLLAGGTEVGEQSMQ